MTRRIRSDSTEAARKAAINVQLPPLQPPKHVNLRPSDLPFWESLMVARPRDTWNTSDLETAANLARCKSDIERVQQEINREGDTIVNARGTEIVNPKHTLLETLSRRCMALSRALHVHTDATVCKTEDARKSSALERETRAIFKELSSDDLIPHVQ